MSSEKKNQFTYTAWHLVMARDFRQERLIGFCGLTLVFRRRLDPGLAETESFDLEISERRVSFPAGIRDYP